MFGSCMNEKIGIAQFVYWNESHQNAQKMHFLGVEVTRILKISIGLISPGDGSLMILLAAIM